MFDKKQVRIKDYFLKHKVAISFFVLLYVISSIATFFAILFFANAVEQLTLGNYNETINIFIIATIIIVFAILTWYLSEICYSNFSLKIMSQLNSDLARQTFNLKSKTFESHNTGTFVQRIVNSPESLARSFRDIIVISTDLITELCVVVYLLVMNFYIGLVLIFAIIVCNVIDGFRLKCYKKNNNKLFKVGDKINSFTNEIIKSEKDIKSLNLENSLNKIITNEYEQYRDIKYKLLTNNMNFFVIRNIIVNIFTLVVLILGIYFLQKELITVAVFMIIYSRKESLYQIIYCLGSIKTFLIDFNKSKERILELFNNEEFATEKFGNKVLENSKGKIEFKNVAYKYQEYKYNEVKNKSYKKGTQKPERVLISENQLFTNLSFKIEPNTTVAFVGKSGSGKTTILNLLSKMYEVDSGEILIDGININDLTKESLRNNISLVNQFPYLFDMTIKENLLLSKNDATDEEIIKVLEDASLLEFVNSIPNGIDTVIGESGIKLSGGQRQRLAIARAMLKKSPIIIFDESTSSLDNFAQNKIKESIDKMKGKTTIVIVAHRLSTIRGADKIFFLDSGEIIDEGTFDELFERNEKFQSMFLVENI